MRLARANGLVAAGLVALTTPNFNAQAGSVANDQLQINHIGADETTVIGRNQAANINGTFVYVDYDLLGERGQLTAQFARKFDSYQCGVMQGIYEGMDPNSTAPVDIEKLKTHIKWHIHTDNRSEVDQAILNMADDWDDVRNSRSPYRIVGRTYTDGLKNDAAAPFPAGGPRKGIYLQLMGEDGEATVGFIAAIVLEDGKRFPWVPAKESISPFDLHQILTQLPDQDVEYLRRIYQGSRPGKHGALGLWNAKNGKDADASPYETVNGEFGPNGEATPRLIARLAGIELPAGTANTTNPFDVHTVLERAVGNDLERLIDLKDKYDSAFLIWDADIQRRAAPAAPAPGS